MVALSVVSAAWGESDSERARQILSQSGIRGGLVAHLGCGDGRVTAELHANERYLVHGLDRDLENVDKARGHIQALGIYGEVSVDRLAGERLPYAGKRSTSK